MATATTRPPWPWLSTCSPPGMEWRTRRRTAHACWPRKKVAPHHRLQAARGETPIGVRRVPRCRDCPLDDVHRRSASGRRSNAGNTSVNAWCKLDPARPAQAPRTRSGGGDDFACRSTRSGKATIRCCARRRGWWPPCGRAPRRRRRQALTARRRARPGRPCAPTLGVVQPDRRMRRASGPERASLVDARRATGSRSSRCLGGARLPSG